MQVNYGEPESSTLIHLTKTGLLWFMMVQAWYQDEGDAAERTQHQAGGGAE